MVIPPLNLAKTLNVAVPDKPNMPDKPKKTSYSKFLNAKKTPSQTSATPSTKNPLAITEKYPSVNEFGSVHTQGKEGLYKIDNDPDRPQDAVGSSVIVEEIDINGNI